MSDLYDLRKIMSSISRVSDVLNVFRSGEYKRSTLFKKKANGKDKNGRTHKTIKDDEHSS